MENPPSPGQVLTNTEITQVFAVGNMGGMRRSTKLNLLVLISDPFKGLYEDRWEGEILHYTGMGPKGDQSVTYAQNRTLARSRETGIAVHLLEALDRQKYTYVGEVELTDAPYEEEQPDATERVRKVWDVSAGAQGKRCDSSDNRRAGASNRGNSGSLSGETLHGGPRGARKECQGTTASQDDTGLCVCTRCGRRRVHKAARRRGLRSV